MRPALRPPVVAAVTLMFGLALAGAGAAWQARQQRTAAGPRDEALAGQVAHRVAAPAQHRDDGPRHIAAAGAAGAALLAGLVYFVALGVQRQREAALDQARHWAIVQSSADAIIGETLDGIVTDWNGGAERLFGHPAAAALGRPAAALLLPPERAGEDDDLCARIARGEFIAPFDTTRRRSDGTLLEVSVTASPIHDSRRRCIGFSKTVRDISEARRSQRTLAALNARLEQQVAERTAQLDTALRDLRAIVDAVPSMIAYWDRDRVNRVSNRAYSGWFGHDPETLRGRPMHELMSGELQARIEPHVRAVLQGVEQNFEISLTRPDGSGRCHSLAHYLPDVVGGEVRGFYVLAHDVSALVESRLQLAAAVRENAALLGTLHEHAIVSVTDRGGRIVEANDNFCRISGYRRDELIGQNHRIVNSGQHRPSFWTAMWRTIGAGQAWRGEVCNRAKDGSLYWVDSVVAPFAGSDGRVEKYVSIRTDITARMRLHDEVRRARADAEDSERFLREITDRIPLRIAYVDAELRFRFVNQAQCLSLGRRREQILGHTRAELTGHAPDPETGRHFEAALRGETRRHECEEESDGHRAAIETRLVPDRDAGGTVRGFYAVSADITERKRAEQRLQQTLVLLNAVLDSATQAAIVAVEPNGIVSIFNAGAERLLGYAAQEVVGRRSALLFHDDDELRRRARSLSLEHGRAVPPGLALTDPAALGEPHEWSYLRKDGSRVPVSLTVTAMRDPQGELFGYLGIAHDIGRQKEQQRSLQHAVRKALQASRAKSQFLANMSHEIRTPLNAVIGLSYLLERTALDAEQASFLAKIKLAGKSLLSTVNDVLDLSKIEAGELKIERAPFDLSRLLRELHQLMTVQAEAKGVALEFDLPAGLPAAVEGDATRVHQVLTNLISNAIKFTERGTVSLGVQPMASTADEVRLRFVVEDDGIGIAPEAMDSLFTPFVQADASTTRRYGGTGLGLSIVKQIVEMMGGEVGASSTPQVGSQFWVELDFPLASEPAAAAADALPAPHAGPGLAGVRVLVADDSSINLDIAKRILELEGALVWLARNGKEAIDYLLALPNAIDVVLMDVQMPVLDGLDAARRIRSGFGLTQLPIIALTAGTLTGEQQQVEAAGMNAFVSKPFDPPALVRCIRRYVRVDPAAVAPVPPPVPGAHAGWPSIDGIDGADSCRRLRGDRALFVSMLRRMLDDFADLGAEPAAGAAALEQRAARLHNLKGSAGMIGAAAVMAGAAEAEAACRLGDGARAAFAVAQLAAQLQSLRQAAAAEIGAADTAAAAAAGAVATQTLPAIGEAEMTELLRLLQQCNLGAIDRFEALAPQLRQRLGGDAYLALRAQVDGLQFDAAAAVLRALAC